MKKNILITILILIAGIAILSFSSKKSHIEQEQQAENGYQRISYNGIAFDYNDKKVAVTIDSESKSIAINPLPGQTIEGLPMTIYTDRTCDDNKDELRNKPGTRPMSWCLIDRDDIFQIDDYGSAYSWPGSQKPEEPSTKGYIVRTSSTELKDGILGYSVLIDMTVLRNLSF